ncbi:hypothetical protein chiPu_0032488, partial [Chiloscyllium punctatum]|nr:hypothetical protein [Chiloscyllium punctatum]
MSGGPSRAPNADPGAGPVAGRLDAHAPAVRELGHAAWVLDSRWMRSANASALREERDLLGLGHAADRRERIVGGGVRLFQEAAGDDGRAERDLCRRSRRSRNGGRERRRHRRRGSDRRDSDQCRLD